MSFEDKTLKCSDCGSDFIFTVGEQEFYQQKGLTNEPKRCSECRALRKGNSGGGYSGSSNKEMFAVVCSECGQDTTVPFKPSTGRPIYCRDCFAKQPRQYR